MSKNKYNIESDSEEYDDNICECGLPISCDHCDPHWKQEKMEGGEQYTCGCCSECPVVPMMSPSRQAEIMRPFVTATFRTHVLSELLDTVL